MVTSFGIFDCKYSSRGQRLALGLSERTTADKSRGTVGTASGAVTTVGENPSLSNPRTVLRLCLDPGAANGGKTKDIKSTLCTAFTILSCLRGIRASCSYKVYYSVRR